LLKAKLAKLRTQLLEPSAGAGKGAGEGFDVVKYGDARVALIGFPSVGKSTALALCKFFNVLPVSPHDKLAGVRCDEVESGPRHAYSPYIFCSAVTGTESEAAAYEFTTLTCIPGVIHYKGTKIQLLDLPGIIEGAASGKGRGRCDLSHFDILTDTH
jgi:ribosome-interacting GTPase 1